MSNPLNHIAAKGIKRKVIKLLSYYTLYSKIMSATYILLLIYFNGAS